MFIGLVAFSLVPGIIGSITKLRGMAIALVIGLFGPIGLCFYMSLMHAPLHGAICNVCNQLYIEFLSGDFYGLSSNSYAKKIHAETLNAQIKSIYHCK